jgi:hypothetical protein
VPLEAAHGTALITADHATTDKAASAVPSTLTAVASGGTRGGTNTGGGVVEVELEMEADRWARWSLTLQAELDSALDLVDADVSNAAKAALALEGTCQRHWSGAYPADPPEKPSGGGGEEQGGAWYALCERRQLLANAYDALARFQCSLSRYGLAAPACAEATALLRLCSAPGACVSPLPACVPPHTRPLPSLY